MSTSPSPGQTAAQVAMQPWKAASTGFRTDNGAEGHGTDEHEHRSSVRKSLVGVRITAVRGQQQNAVMLALLMLVVVGSAVICLAPEVSAQSLIQQSSVRQGIALAVGLIALALITVGWMQRRAWERCTKALERLARSGIPEVASASFLRELLAIFTDAFTAPVPPVQPRALAAREIPPDLAPVINEFLHRLHMTAAELAACQQTSVDLERNHQAVQMVIRYYEKQGALFQAQLWRTVLVEKAQLGLDSLLAESLYVGAEAPAAAALVAAIQTRDAAILRQLVREEAIRATYAAAARDACNRFLAGDTGVRVPRRQEDERELGDLVSLADGINELLVRGELRTTLLNDVCRVVEGSLQHPEESLYELDAVVELVHPGALDDTVHSLVRALRRIFTQLAAQRDQSPQLDSADSPDR